MHVRHLQICAYSPMGMGKSKRSSSLKPMLRELSLHPLKGASLGVDSPLVSAILLFKDQPFPPIFFGCGVLERFGSLERIGKLPLEQ